MKIEKYNDGNIITIEMENNRKIVIVKENGAVKVMDNTSTLTNNELLKSLPWSVRTTVLLLS